MTNLFLSSAQLLVRQIFELGPVKWITRGQKMRWQLSNIIAMFFQRVSNILMLPTYHCCHECGVRIGALTEEVQQEYVAPPQMLQLDSRSFYT